METCSTAYANYATEKVGYCCSSGRMTLSRMSYWFSGKYLPLMKYSRNRDRTLSFCKFLPIRSGSCSEASATNCTMNYS